MSVDGFIADKDGGVSWLDPFNDVDFGYKKFIDSIGSLIMGAKTYEQVLSFGDWPYKNKKSYVLTHRSLQTPLGEDIEFVDGDVESITRKAKDAAGDKNVWLVGGASVVASFLNKQAIDEMMIFIIPTLLNEGIPLFQGATEKSSLKLLNTESYSNGALLLHYGLK